MESSLLEFLSTHPLFQNLEKTEIESLDHLVTEEDIPASSYIFLEEEAAHHFYILKEGLLQAKIGAKLLTTIKPGQFFGEIAMLNESYRTGSVYAVENSRVIKVDGKELIHGNSVPVEISFKKL